MTDCPVRSDAIDISPVDDGYVVFDPGRDLVHYLNHTAAMTLELCDGQRTADEITAFLTEVFAAADGVAESVTSCLSQLRALGLVLPAQRQPPDAVSTTTARAAAARTRGTGS